MPPKKEERKPLERIFQYDEESEQIWKYQVYEKEDIDKINEFLTYFKPELTQLLTENIYENFEILCKQIGVFIHPALIKPKLEEIEDAINFDNQKSFNSQQDLNALPDNEQNQQPQQEEVKNPTCLFISSILIDYCTLKLLDFCLGVSGIQVIKFTNNNLNYHEFLAITNIANNEENKLVKLFLDWNNLGVLEERQEILEKLALSQTIEFLTLRSNKLGDQGVTELCNALVKNPNSQLKCLDLYENEISGEGIKAVGNLLVKGFYVQLIQRVQMVPLSFQDWQKIEYRSLRIYREQLQMLANSYKRLNKQKSIEQQKKKEMRQQRRIRKLNKRSRQRNQSLFWIHQLRDKMGIGTWQRMRIQYLIKQMKNAKLWLLNLSMNKLDDSCKDQVEKFLQQTHENFSLVLTSNKFEDSKLKDKLRKKWGKRIAV